MKALVSLKVGVEQLGQAERTLFWKNCPDSIFTFLGSFSSTPSAAAVLVCGGDSMADKACIPSCAWISAAALVLMYSLLPSVIYLSLSRGLTKEAISSRSLVAGSEYFSLRYWRIAVFMCFVRSMSSSEWGRTVLFSRWSTGLRYHTLTYCSPDSASVNSVRGLKVLLTDSPTSISCQVGTRCLVFLSALRTCDMNQLYHLLVWLTPCWCFSD